MGDVHTNTQDYTMKLYKFNYFCDYQIHAGQQWATSAFDVKREILARNAGATGIDIWVV